MKLSAAQIEMALEFLGVEWCPVTGMPMVGGATFSPVKLWGRIKGKMVTVSAQAILQTPSISRGFEAENCKMLACRWGEFLEAEDNGHGIPQFYAERAAYRQMLSHETIP